MLSIDFPHSNKMLQVILTVIALVTSAYANSCTITSYNEVSTVVSNCTTITVGNLAVPAGKTLTLNLKTGTHLTFTGTVAFGHANWNGPLMKLTGEKIVVTGATNHVLHGHGELYWDGKGGSGTTKPVFISVQGTNAVFNKLHFKNCPERCVSLHGTNVELDGWRIDNSEGAEGKAPKGKEGHNTDGFDVSAHGVTVKNAVVINQDDCVAVNYGTNMLFENMHCTGSHGLSIATGMGTQLSQNIVSNITFRNSVLEGGMNGIRIKTCNDGGPGKMDSITYENIAIKGPSTYGICIQQDYSWKQGGSTGHPKGNVPISNVKVENVSGYMNTSNRGSTAVTIVCATNACKSFTFKNVTLTKGAAKNNCNFEPTGYTC